MIYLFEDRESRKKELLSDNGTYPLICQKPFDCASSEIIDTFILDNYSDAKVVLLHKSYGFKENSNITPDLVKEKFSKLLNIPVVLFSGGSNSNLVDEGDKISAEINSGVMYRNFRAFHDAYAKTGIPNLAILVFGVDYKRNQLLRMQDKLYRYFFDRNPQDSARLSARDTAKVKQILRDVNDPELIGDIMKLKDLENKEGKWNVVYLMDQVQKMINLY